ncbi:hypothetical protein BDK51DRAFT_44136 [Blyttiomyces helicus]|uniref:DUF4470 domain-containing protein n=1 Tax=Blyttiomyces helicus TaxID=388810 RepID=A0A4P9W9P9_9FUNG|nr:hypothetical protein BDK51DRAFT_44136 [Blyttiomyces helicus]|eukprot:RKO89134.1 hypothetical protein BDK51DRAFT_44136 [Blyttiomyces helicus]
MARSKASSKTSRRPDLQTDSPDPAVPNPLEGRRNLLLDTPVQNVHVNSHFLSIYSSIPARNLTDSAPIGVPRLDVLLLGDSDLRHLTFTTWNARNVRQALLLDFSVVNANPAVLARTTLLLCAFITYRFTPEKLRRTWALAFHHFLDPEGLKMVKATAKDLLEPGERLKDFHAHKFGKLFRFSSESSYAAIRGIWKKYAADTRLKYKTFKAEIARLRDEMNETSMVEGEGSAGPCADWYAEDASDLFHTFWRKGILDPSLSGNLPNPLLAYTHNVDSFALHSYENPMDGFHLAAAYADLIEPGPEGKRQSGRGLDSLIEIAHRQWKEWAEAFVDSFREKGGVRVHFCCLEPFDFAAALGHVVSEGTKHVRPLPVFHVSTPSHEDLAPFIFCEEEYGALSTITSAPVLFDVIDTPIVLDGRLLPLLLLTGPLLKPVTWSLLHSASVDHASFDNELGDRLNEKLGMDTCLFAALVGLAPASDIIGWAPQLQPIVEERWAAKMLRVRWRQAALLDPYLFEAIDSWPAASRSKLQIDRTHWVNWMAHLISVVCKGEIWRAPYRISPQRITHGDVTRQGFVRILSWFASRLELADDESGIRLVSRAFCQEMAMLANSIPETAPSIDDLRREVEMWSFIFGQMLDSELIADPAEFARERTGGTIIQRGSLNGTGLPTVLRVVILVPITALEPFSPRSHRFPMINPLLDVHLKPNEGTETFVYETTEIRTVRRTRPGELDRWRLSCADFDLVHDDAGTDVAVIFFVSTVLLLETKPSSMNMRIVLSPRASNLIQMHGRSSLPAEGGLIFATNFADRTRVSYVCGVPHPSQSTVARTPAPVGGYAFRTPLTMLRGSLPGLVRRTAHKPNPDTEGFLLSPIKISIKQNNNVWELDYYSVSLTSPVAFQALGEGCLFAVTQESPCTLTFDFKLAGKTYRPRIPFPAPISGFTVVTGPPQNRTLKIRVSPARPGVESKGPGVESKSPTFESKSFALRRGPDDPLSFDPLVVDPRTRSLVLVDIPRVNLDVIPFVDTNTAADVIEEAIDTWCLQDMTSCPFSPGAVPERTGIDEFNATVRYMVDLRRREPGTENDWAVDEDIFDDDSDYGQLMKCPKVFALKDGGKTYCYVIVIDVRLDSTTENIVLNASVSPLSSTQLDSSLVREIPTSEAETKVWRRVLPAMVERARYGYTHNPLSCIYLRHGRIPTTDPLLCSCGAGQNLGWDFASNSVTPEVYWRAAITPLFVHDPYDPYAPIDAVDQPLVTSTGDYAEWERMRDALIPYGVRPPPVHPWFDHPGPPVGRPHSVADRRETKDEPLHDETQVEQRSDPAAGVRRRLELFRAHPKLATPPGSRPAIAFPAGAFPSGSLPRQFDLELDLTAAEVAALGLDSNGKPPTDDEGHSPGCTCGVPVPQPKAKAKAKARAKANATTETTKPSPVLMVFLTPARFPPPHRASSSANVTSNTGKVWKHFQRVSPMAVLPGSMSSAMQTPHAS